MKKNLISSTAILIALGALYPVAASAQDVVMRRPVPSTSRGTVIVNPDPDNPTNPDNTTLSFIGFKRCVGGTISHSCSSVSSGGTTTNGLPLSSCSAQNPADAAYAQAVSTFSLPSGATLVPPSQVGSDQGAACGGTGGTGGTGGSDGSGNPGGNTTVPAETYAFTCQVFSGVLAPSCERIDFTQANGSFDPDTVTSENVDASLCNFDGTGYPQLNKDVISYWGANYRLPENNVASACGSEPLLSEVINHPSCGTSGPQCEKFTVYYQGSLPSPTIYGLDIGQGQLSDCDGSPASPMYQYLSDNFGLNPPDFDTSTCAVTPPDNGGVLPGFVVAQPSCSVQTTQLPDGSTSIQTVKNLNCENIQNFTVTNGMPDYQPSPVSDAYCSQPSTNDDDEKQIIADWFNPDRIDPNDIQPGCGMYWNILGDPRADISPLPDIVSESVTQTGPDDGTSYPVDISFVHRYQLYCHRYSGNIFDLIPVDQDTANAFIVANDFENSAGSCPTLLAQKVEEMASGGDPSAFYAMGSPSGDGKSYFPSYIAPRSTFSAWNYNFNASTGILTLSGTFPGRFNTGTPE
jgi:hypothetical protein